MQALKSFIFNNKYPILAGGVVALGMMKNYFNGGTCSISKDLSG